MKALLIPLLFISLAAFSGEKGNGGYSVVCRDASGAITSAELLDIYEGRILYKRSYAVDQNSVDDLLAIALSRLVDYPELIKKIEKEIAFIEANKLFIPAGNELELTDDAFPVIRKFGCKFEQLANYTEDADVLISQEIFDRIDNVNRAALLLHEAIYSIRRKALSEKTSQNTRKLVSQLLALDADAAVVRKWAVDSLYRPAGQRPCGLSGSIQERIESCSYIQPSSAYLQLVTRTIDLKEVWADRTNNLLWGDRLPQRMSLEKAKTACGVISSAMGGLVQHQWRLPRAEDFSKVSEALMMTLPNMTSVNENFWFWTSTKKGSLAVIFNGSDASLGYNPFKNNSSGSVRCVSPLL